MDSKITSQTPAAALEAAQVAAFLTQHPDFFQQHAEIFAQLSVPHPHQGRAISLGERQVISLRAQIERHSESLHGLLEQAERNHQIVDKLLSWCAELLALTDAAAIPARILGSLNQYFDLDASALLCPEPALLLCAAPSTPVKASYDTAHDIAQDAPQLAAALEATAAIPAPQCHAAAAWPAIASGLPIAAQSLAIIPLQPGALVLASSDAERFTPEMGTEFLQLIGTLAGAALQRWRAPA